jgi:hypothetical protein
MQKNYEKRIFIMIVNAFPAPMNAGSKSAYEGHLAESRGMRTSRGGRTSR